MISVANKFDVYRNPSSSAADLSFFGMEISRASSDLDPKSRVPEEVDDRSPSPESRVSGSDDPSLSVHGFKTGDLVWGKVKSHPWWPGHIFSEAFASPSVRRTRREGHVLVAFFGDSSYGWFDLSELVHFAPTFLEKSRQTTSRSFVKAVEESVDESSRRAALGLSCMCRNPYNFRPTRVPGYRAVDVPGYEPGGIYSLGRIRKAREEFVPEESAAFLRKVALAPTSAEPRDLEWIKRVAQLLAFRRARFEEFDETYAQAFGQQLVRHPQDNLENEPEKFAPPKVALAPLSGPLVIAEALGSSSNKRKKNKKKKDDGSSLPRRSSATATKSSAAAAAATSSKKKEDKYLLKRRDEHPVSNPLPDASYPPQPTQAGTTPLPEMDHFVLQKREPESIRDDDDQKPKPTSPPALPLPVAAPATAMPVEPSTAMTMPVEPSVPIPVVDHDSTRGVDASQPDREGKSVEGKPKPKKKKKKKRPREDVDDKGETLQAKATKTKKKKKKKMEGLGSMASTLKKLAMGIEEDSAPRPEEPPADASDSNAPRAASAPQVDPSSLDLPLLLDDLYALAMDPFYGVDCDATATACRVFLKFRSLVYQKSLVLPLASEVDDQEARPRKPSSPPPPPKEPKEKEKKEKKEKAVKVKLGSLFKRSSDPPKSGRKRPLSDRQEESSAKRSKKLDQLKSLATGKKATLALQTTTQGHKDNNAASTSANSSLPITATAAADPAGKPERQEPLLPLPPKKESPTNLILKFPPRSTLPSVANLKARFARFGPLVVDRCRVIWNTHSCRVQFRYKVDALEAYNYVRDNNLFGQIQVRYSVKEVEMPGPQPEPGRQLPEPQPESSSQSRPGNGTGNPIARSRPSHLPLKSILKRPGGEDAGKENQRVKFKLAGDVERASVPVNAISPDVPSPPRPSSLTSSTRAPKSSTDFLPPRTATFAPQPPLLPRPVPSQPPASMLPRSFEPPPLPPHPQTRPPVSQFGESHLRQQVLRYGGGSSSGGADDTDVTHKLLSLMLRCNDIVTTLNSLPGFVSYRPL